MAIALENFWRSMSYNHPPLTDEMIVEAERRLDVKLPSEYLALLRIQNGGNTHGFGYPMTQRTSWADDHIPLYDLFGIVTDPEVRTAHNLLDTEYLTEEWGLPPRQALLTGEGHWWITLDYRRGAEPVVTWLNVDRGQDFEVAPSFASFLANLRPIREFA